MATLVGKHGYKGSEVVPTSYLPAGIDLAAHLAALKAARQMKREQEAAGSHVPLAVVAREVVQILPAENPQAQAATWTFWSAFIQPVIDTAVAGKDMAYNGAVMAYDGAAASAASMQAFMGLSAAQQDAIIADMESKQAAEAKKS